MASFPFSPTAFHFGVGALSAIVPLQLISKDRTGRIAFEAARSLTARRQRENHRELQWEQVGNSALVMVVPSIPRQGSCRGSLFEDDVLSGRLRRFQLPDVRARLMPLIAMRRGFMAYVIRSVQTQMELE